MTQSYQFASEGKCHGRSAKPAQPSTSHMRAVVVIGFTPSLGRATLFRQIPHLVVPLGQQAPALRRGAVLDEVEIDQLDFSKLRRLRRHGSILVRGHLERSTP